LKQKKVAHFEKIVAAGRVSAPLFLMLQKGLKWRHKPRTLKKVAADGNLENIFVPE
jgi:hypothetical protein